MRVHRTAYRAMKAWAGDSRRRQTQLRRDSGLLLKKLMKKGEIEQFQAPASEGYRFWYIVTKPTDWLALDVDVRVGRAESTKAEVLKALGLKKAKRLRPGVYLAGAPGAVYLVGQRGALEQGGGDE